MELVEAQEGERIGNDRNWDTILVTRKWREWWALRIAHHVCLHFFPTFPMWGLGGLHNQRQLAEACMGHKNSKSWVKIKTGLKSKKLLRRQWHFYSIIYVGLTIFKCNLTIMWVRFMQCKLRLEVDSQLWRILPILANLKWQVTEMI